MSLLHMEVCCDWSTIFLVAQIKLADVSGAGTRDKPLRTSAWEATGFISQPLIGETYGFQKKSLEYVSHKPSRNSVLHTLQELPVPVRNWLDDQRRITCREASYFFVFCFIVLFDSWMRIFQSIFSIISSPDVNKESYFFQACERAESSKSCNLIGSESGRYFTILPANPGGIVGSFIHKFVCCLWMSKNRHFQTIFLLKLALLLALARAKWILLFRQKIWRENQANQPAKVKQNTWLVMLLH